jgi:hypothetical protein
MICADCGGEDVSRDASAAWNEETQQWELKSVFDAGYCEDCSEEVTLETKEIA